MSFPASYRFACRSHGDEPHIFGGKVASPAARDLLAWWCRSHSDPGCRIVQEYGPKFDLRPFLEGSKSQLRGP